MWDFLKHLIPTKNSYPEWYQEYADAFQKPAWHASIPDCKFIVLDTETTGLNPETDAILSIGAIKIQAYQVNLGEVFTHRILQKATIHDQAAIPIHGILHAEKKGEELSQVIPNFFSYLGKSIIVGHHIRFDQIMVNKSSAKLGGGPLLNYVLDTAELAQRLDNPHGDMVVSREKYTLDALCHRFHIETKERHTALGDAYLTGLVFMKILAALEKRGVSTLAELRPKPGDSSFRLRIF